MATSCVPDVKQALLDGLPGEAALSDVRVSWGAPIENYPEEVVVLGDATAPQTARHLGNLKRNEEVELTIFVDVNRRTRDQGATTKRAYTLAAAIEDYLRNDPSLSSDYSGGAQIVSAQFGGVPRLEEYAGDGTRRALLTCTVNVEARL